jgi:hypothetical protein
VPVHQIQIKVILDVRHLEDLDRTEHVFVLTEIGVPRQVGIEVLDGIGGS